jgi:nitroreductase
MQVSDSVTQRQCIRAFLDKAVDPQVISEILNAARWAPSGANTQPWQVMVVSGKTKQTIGDRIIAAREDGQKENPDYDYYPENWVEPYRRRRYETGMALYSALHIEKSDDEKRKAAWYQNYHFFGAPVGLLFFIDKQMGRGSLLDMGMFIQNIMLMAEHHGLGTCPQASLAEYPDIVREILKVENDYLLLCGMALGYPDSAAPVNNYRVERVGVEDFTRWYD